MSSRLSRQSIWDELHLAQFMLDLRGCLRRDCATCEAHASLHLIWGLAGRRSLVVMITPARLWTSQKQASEARRINRSSACTPYKCPKTHVTYLTTPPKRESNSQELQAKALFESAKNMQFENLEGSLICSILESLQLIQKRLNTLAVQ